MRAARQQLLPDAKPSVLPYVAINGQRRVPKDTFDSVFLPAMSESSAISTTLGDATLAIAVNDTADDTVSIGYTYSRPARKDGDALYKPDRSKVDASVIPEDFFQELASFSRAEAPFSMFADAAKVRDDKLLSWLMRSVKLSPPDVKALPPRCGLLGDAAHAMPIVAGEGGNHAILDGLALGDALANDQAGGYARFIEKNMQRWESGVEQSETNLADLHRGGSKL